MFRMIWKIEKHKTLPWFIGVLLILAGYTLFNPKTLGTTSLFVIVLGAAQGWMLAARLFRDSKGTGAFVFSRPLSRARIFWYRWFVGIAFQAVTLLVLAALLVLGARQAIQREMFDSVVYPMIRYYELAVLWPVGIASFLFYQVVSFVTLRNRAVRTVRGKGGWWAKVGMVALVGAVGLLFFSGRVVAASMYDIAPSPFGMSFQWMAIVHLLILAAMTMLSSVQCYRNLEIEA